MRGLPVCRRREGARRRGGESHHLGARCGRRPYGLSCVGVFPRLAEVQRCMVIVRLLSIWVGSRSVGVRYVPPTVGAHHVFVFVPEDLAAAWAFLVVAAVGPEPAEYALKLTILVGAKDEAQMAMLARRAWSTLTLGGTGQVHDVRAFAAEQTCDRLEVIVYDESVLSAGGAGPEVP